MPEIRHPGEGAISKPEYDAQFAETCDNCEAVNSFMGKHVVTYTATDSNGKLLEKLSLCLDCRFAWLQHIITVKGLHLRKDVDGNIFMVQGGITLRPELAARGPFTEISIDVLSQAQEEKELIELLKACEENEDV